MGFGSVTGLSGPRSAVWPWALLLLAACNATGAGETNPPATASGRWQDDPLWNDGQAEVSVFNAQESKYGIRRSFRYLHVVVAEDLRRDLMVKSDVADPPGGLIRVLKNNQQWDIPSGVYSYRQMASVFLDMSELRPLKVTFTSHELCGNTFYQLLAPRGDRRKGTLQFFSYFDGEADQSFPVDLTGVQVYDGLPVSLRAIPFAEGYTERLDLLGSLASSHGRAPRIRPVEVRVTGQETIETGLGEILAWTVNVGDRSRSGEIDHFWFEKDRPHRLLRWDQADGGRYVLENARRMKYWQLNRPGDEAELLKKE
jgi:hypothetical protein